jgi:predicted dehydrogenase
MLWQVYVRELAKLVTKGTIGTLQRIEVSLGHGGPSWGWNNHFMNPTLSGGGALADMGIHAIGIAYGILGQEYHVTKIKTLNMHSGTKPERTMSDSDGANEYLMHKFMVEDDARVQITLQHATTHLEVILILETSWSRTLQTTEVFGTKGNISMETDDRKRKVFVVTDPSGNKRVIDMPPQGRDSHQIEIIDFIDRIINKKKPYLDATWAHEMQSIISGTYLSYLKAYLNTSHPSDALEGMEISMRELDVFYENILQSGCPTQILIEEIVYQLMGPFTNTKNDSEKK